MSRVQLIVAKANSRLNMKLAAILLASSSLLSSLLGFLRDRLLNTYYYDTLPNYADAYTVAFIIPDFMFFILVSGALSVSFIPIFNERMESGNKKSAWELTGSLLNLLALVTLVTSVLIIIFAEPLVQYVVGPGLDEVGRGLAVSMMRVIAINPFLFAISSVIASVQQAVGRFTFYALAPVMYNIGIIIGILGFTGGINIFGFQIFEGGIMGVALGVVLGSVLQLITSLVGLIGLGIDYDFNIYWKNHGFKRVLRLLPARSLDQGIDYFNNIVETNLASHMAYGSVRAYNQATTLYSVPVNLVGVAISTAAFPQMAKRLSQGRPDLFRKELQSILRIIIWLALPITFVVLFTSEYLSTFLFPKGAQVVAAALSILSVAILFRSVFHIASRSFYAQQDTKTPLYISIFAIGFNIIFAVILTTQFNMGIYGLAIAQGLTAVIEVAILFRVMSKRIPKLFDGVFVGVVVRMVFAAICMSTVTIVMMFLMGPVVADQGFYILFPKFVIVAGVSVVAYTFISRSFRLEEAEHVIDKAKQILGKIAFGQIVAGGRKKD
ncbi:murein biosynthesis integral membrane protein MurJ [Candidatus Saccharibacteria bacterium]|nr:murein biosynthesis integral membrane protein MurJ [Candidatus Saccharibacteria bacterium]NCU40633.1 murein biosynthesis integral membrane protein MurJ [Candidatus Saccharibacteria bacterium]